MGYSIAHLFLGALTKPIPTSALAARPLGRNLTTWATGMEMGFMVRQESERHVRAAIATSKALACLRSVEILWSGLCFCNQNTRLSTDSSISHAEALQLASPHFFPILSCHTRRSQKKRLLEAE